MPENIDIEALKFVGAVAGAAGAIAAAIVAGIFSLIMNWLNRRSEERKHLLDICSKLASENLARDIENARINAAKTGHPVPLAPIDAYFIHMLSLVKAIRFRGSHRDMMDKWRNISSITRTEIRKAIEEDAERRKQNSGAK